MKEVPVEAQLEIIEYKWNITAEEYRNALDKDFKEMALMRSDELLDEYRAIRLGQIPVKEAYEEKE